MNKSDILAWKKGFDVSRKAAHSLVKMEKLDRERSVRLALGLIDYSYKYDISKKSEKYGKMHELEIMDVRKRWIILKGGIK